MGSPGGSKNTPTLVSNLTHAVSLSGGGQHMCAVREDGTAFCWGYNTSKQLGANLTAISSNVPLVVQGLTGVALIAAGNAFTCAVKTDGSVWCWGDNLYGQLGDGTKTGSGKPIAVKGLGPCISVAAGASHACAVGVDGKVWCWGDNGNGKLGNGTTGGGSLTPFWSRRVISRRELRDQQRPRPGAGQGAVGKVS